MRPRLAPIAASRFEFVAALPADEIVPVPTGIETAGIEIVGKEIAGIEIAGIDGIETEKNGIRTLSIDSSDDPAPLPLDGVRGPEGCMDLIDAERGLGYNLFSIAMVVTDSRN
jgi:hypothetical protein